MRTLLAGVLSAALAVVSPVPASSAPETAGPPEARAAALAPALRVTRVVGGLDIPWDVQPIGRGRMLVTERSTARLFLVVRHRKRLVQFPSASVWASGETGLMSLEVDPGFSRNRRIYTCQGATTSTGHDVRVVAWRLSPRATRVRRLGTLVAGLPARTGRHGGCRLLVLRDGSLLVGTGDAALGTNPRDLTSLGGKTLRLDRFTGRPWPRNPFIGSGNARTRYVLTYGHRNVQGLAQRRDGTLWSVEHGSDRDDEVNRLVAGGDYGWNPVPGYDESVPMTDHSLPGRQVSARWSSGFPTIATSGATFVRGAAWGSYRGTLAVAALKGSRMLFMRFDRSGRLGGVRAPAALRAYGRLRSVTQAPNGSLLVTTSNGGGRDVVLRVSPG